MWKYLEVLQHYEFIISFRQYMTKNKIIYAATIYVVKEQERFSFHTVLTSGTTTAKL